MLVTNKIEIDIRPQPAVRMTQRSKWNKQSQRYLAYKNNIRLLSNNMKLPETLFLGFYFKCSASWNDKKKQLLIDKPHQYKPDLDNLVKGVMDSLTTEDSNVHQIVAMKLWSDEDKIIIGTVENF